MSLSPAEVFARFLRDSPDEVLDILGENVESLVGKSVDLEPITADEESLKRTFGSKKLYVFPIEDHQGNQHPAIIAMDLGAAVHSGAAFSMMGPEQVREVLKTGKVPEILHDSVGEVANILCGAAVTLLRDRTGDVPEFRRAPGFELKRIGGWPRLLTEIDAEGTWYHAAAKLVIDGADSGAALFAAAEPRKVEEAAPELTADKEVKGAPKADRDAEIALPPGLRVLVASHPADAAALQMRQLLAKIGCEVLPGYQVKDAFGTLDALVIISRSPTDLKLRLEALAGPRKPRLVIAASDRPTKGLVMTSRASGAGGFVVLPAEPRMLRKLLAPLGEQEPQQV